MRSFLKTKLPRYSIRKIGTVAVSVMTAMSVFTPSIAQASTGNGSNDNGGSTVTQNTDNSSADQQTTGKGNGAGSTGTGKGKGTGKPDNNVNDNADALKVSENNEKGSEAETQRPDTKGTTESMNVSDPSSHTQVSANMIGASEVAVNTETGNLYKDDTKLIDKDKDGKLKSIGEIAKNLDQNNILGIASEFHVFAHHDTKIYSHVDGNVATENLYDNGHDFGTKDENHKEVDNTLGDISYVANIVDNLNFNSFNAGNGANTYSKLILGDKGKNINISIDKSQNRVDIIQNGKKYELDGNIVHPDEVKKDSNYINLDNEFEKLSKKSDSLFNKDSHIKDKAQMSNDGQQYYDDVFDVSSVDPENNCIYIQLSGKALSNANNKFTIRGIGKVNKNGKVPTVVINVKDDYDNAKEAAFSANVVIEYGDSTNDIGQGSDHTQTNRILWNFGTNIETLNINKMLRGSVLATNATINANVNVDGNIVGNNVVLKGETHRWDLKSEVPSVPYIPGGEYPAEPGNKPDKPTKPEQPTNVVPPKGEDKPKNPPKNDQPSIPSQDHHDDDNIPPKGEDKPKNPPKNDQPSTPSKNHHDDDNIPPKGDKPGNKPGNGGSTDNHHDDNNIPPKSDNPTTPTNNTDVPQTPSNDVPPKADIPTTPLTPSDDEDFYPSLNKSQKSPSSPATFAPLSKQSFKKNKSNTKKNSKMTYFAAQSKKTLNGKQRKTEFNDLTVREAKKSEDNTIDLIAKKSEKSTNLPKQTVSKHQAALPQTGAKKGFAIVVLGMALTVLSFGLIKLSKREN